MQLAGSCFQLYVASLPAALIEPCLCFCKALDIHPHLPHPLQELPGGNENNGTHSDAIERVIYVPEVDKYITCSRDATFRIWNCADLRHNRTQVNGLRWVNDAAYMPNQRKLVVASMDRSLTWYDVNRGSYDSIGRYVCLHCAPFLLLFFT